MNRHFKTSRTAIPAYPNQAPVEYHVQRLLDGITCVITGMGIVAIFIFFITM